jgi:proliferating cell nuclear antigen
MTGVVTMSKAVETDDGENELEPSTSDGAAAEIVTRGDPIRSFHRLLAPVVDECRLRVDEDGLHITAVDPANVLQIDVTAYAEGFRKFETDGERVLGLNLDRFRKAVEWARKTGGDGGDPVKVDVLPDPDRIRVGVTRPDQGVKRTSEWFALDPDSLRPAPDPAEFDLPCVASPDVRPFRDGVAAFEPDYAAMAYDDGTLVLQAGEADPDEGTAEERVMFPNVARNEAGDGSEPSSLFSLDYLESVADALKRSKADHLAVEWGEEFPTELQFKHEEWGFEGKFVLAPRIQETDA